MVNPVAVGKHPTQSHLPVKAGLLPQSRGAARQGGRKAGLGGFRGDSHTPQKSVNTQVSIETWRVAWRRKCVAVY